MSSVGERALSHGTDGANELAPQDWSSGICECGQDCHNAWDVCLCFHCVLFQQYNKFYYDQGRILWSKCLGIFCLDACCTCGFANMYIHYTLRQDMRRRYHITSNATEHNAQGTPKPYQGPTAGESCSDCCSVYFCATCTLCQQHREMTHRGIWPGKCLFGHRTEKPKIAVPGNVELR